MAATTFCDWCGELMEPRAEGEKMAELVLAGYGGMEGANFIHEGLGFNYHVATEGWPKRIDPDCCLGKLITLLEERKSWAHDPNQNENEWRLVRRDGRTLTRREERTKLREEEWEEAERKSKAWKRTPKERRIELVKEQLGDGNRTIRELVEAIEEANPELALTESTLRPLVNELYATDELDREAENYRNGPQVRYRYSLAGAEGAE